MNIVAVQKLTPTKPGVAVEPEGPAALFPVSSASPAPAPLGWSLGRPALLRRVGGVSQVRQMRCDGQMAPGTIRVLGWDEAGQRGVPL